MKKVVFQKKSVSLFKMARESVQRRDRRLDISSEIAALVERNFSERPDLWQSLADSPTPIKSPK